MPNWCNTHYKIIGPKNDIKKLHDALLILNNEHEDYEGEFLRELCINPDNYDHMRGFIYDFKLISDECLELDADEAWGPTSLIDALKDEFQDIEVYYCAIEPGCGLYVTNDALRRYFPERYIVSYEIDGKGDTEYFENETDLNNWLSEQTKGKVKCIDDTIEYCETEDYNYIDINEIEIE